MSNACTKIESILARIPNEVFSEIFLRCCPSVNDRSPIASLSPLTLSHVCRLWRNIAFNTPQLWSYSSLGAPRHSLASLREMLKIWMGNVKSCSLTVDIDLKAFAQYKRPDDILPLVKDITMLVAEMKPSLLAFEIPLTVSITPQKFPYVDESFSWTSYGLPPALQPQDVVEIRIVTRPCMLYGMSLHATFGPHIVYLDLRDFEENMSLPPDAATEILRAYPKLRHLALRLGEAPHDVDGDTVTGKVYELKDLEHLCISWDDGAFPAQFLSSIHAQNLTELELDGFAEDHDPIWQALLGNLRRAHPPLRALDLYRINCGGTSLAQVLALCRGLERLWISDSTIDVHSIRGSFYPPGVAPTEVDVAGVARHTMSSSLRTLGLVRCEMQGMSSLFASLMLSGKIWSDTRLEGLYVADCGLSIHAGSGYTGLETSGALHLLRSKWAAGEYEDLGAHVSIGGENGSDRVDLRPEWVRRLFFTFRP